MNHERRFAHAHLFEAECVCVCVSVSFSDINVPMYPIIRIFLVGILVSVGFSVSLVHMFWFVCFGCFMLFHLVSLGFGLVSMLVGLMIGQSLCSLLHLYFDELIVGVSLH